MRAMFFKITVLSLSLLCIHGSVLYAGDTYAVNGQIRSRTQISNKDFNSATGINSFTELRTRLGIKFSPAHDLSAFIQLQDSRRFGTEPNTLTATNNADVHQAYFKIHNFFNLPLDVTAGRMELSYGAQRLLGAVGWHNVGRSFDGGMVKLHTSMLDVDFIGTRLTETGKTSDSLDTWMHAAYGNLKLVKDHKIQPYVIAESIADSNFNRYTVGLLMSGSIAGISHEIEMAYQGGSVSKNVDIAAYMLTLNVSYKFNAPFTPLIGGGVDYLSGDDEKNPAKVKVFHTLYATNHKFYGFMDYFLNIPKDTYKKGLTDMYGKVALTPVKKLKLTAVYHVFQANADYTLTSGSTSKSFGSEADITLVYKYSDPVKLQGGFSMFMPGAIFKETKGKDSASWAYLMAVINL